MKKLLSILVVAMLLINSSSIAALAYSSSGAYSSPGNTTKEDLTVQKQVIAIVPLDSRPCNTQYPQLIGGIMNQTVLLPPTEILDNYTASSDTEALWTWMDENAKISNKMIIYTNQLLNGGLISSRSYVNSDAIEYDVNRLTRFIEAHPDVEVTVVSILPRLRPSQFDIYFKKYQKSLTAWGKLLDYNYTMKLPVPKYPEDVPLEITQRYKDLYTYHANLSTAISNLADKGVIKRYFIGQDDGEQFAPSNIIYRNLLNKSYKNVTVQKGADELTMMICAMENKTAHEINLVYTNPAAVTAYLPYESASLEDIVQEKLSIFGITINPDAKDTLIVHNDQLYTDRVQSLIPQEKSGYIAIADVAYTNRGDVGLKNLLFQKGSLSNIDAYSGWNTASNSIGTALSQYVATKFLEQNYDKIDEFSQRQCIDSIMKFKYVRLAEDIIYQGLMVANMRPIFSARGMRMSNGDLYSDKKHDAEQLLNEYGFKYIIELNKIFSGSNILYLGNKAIKIDYNFINSIFSYPWHRTFEIFVSPIFSKSV
ncbi:MAG: DUF4127 family protein [Proteocatella sp.]